MGHSFNWGAGLTNADTLHKTVISISHIHTTDKNRPHFLPWSSLPYRSHSSAVLSSAAAAGPSPSRRPASAQTMARSNPCWGGCVCMQGPGGRNVVSFGSEKGEPSVIAERSEAHLQGFQLSVVRKLLTNL